MNPGPCEVCGQAKRLLFTNYACLNERCGQPEDKVNFYTGPSFPWPRTDEIRKFIEDAYEEVCKPKIWVPLSPELDRIAAVLGRHFWGQED